MPTLNTSMRFTLWHGKGFKTLYYCRSEKLAKADKVSRSIEREIIKKSTWQKSPLEQLVLHVRDKMSKMTDERSCFRPFSYPWAFEAWLQHEQIHWLHTEVPMAEDISDWKNKLSESEKKFLTHIFRFFTQGDIDVAGGYVNNYLP